MTGPVGYEDEFQIGARPYLSRTGGTMFGPVVFNVSGATTPHIATGTGFGPLVLGKAATAAAATADTDVVVGDDFEVRGVANLASNLVLLNGDRVVQIGLSNAAQYKRTGLTRSGGSFAITIADSGFSATGRGVSLSGVAHASGAYGVNLIGNIVSGAGNEAGPIGLYGGYNSADAGRNAPVFVGNRQYSTVSAYAALFTNQADPLFAVFDRENPASVLDHFLYLQRKRTVGAPVTYYSLLASALGPVVIGNPALDPASDPVYNSDAALSGSFVGLSGLRAGAAGLVSGPGVDLRLRAGVGLTVGGGDTGALEAGDVRVRFGVFVDDDTVVHDGYIIMKDDAGTERWIGIVKEAE